MRLNIASGTAVRFEPGQQRTVELVDYAGARRSGAFAARCKGSSDGDRSGAAPMPRCSAPRSATACAWPTPSWSIEVEHDYTLRAGGYGEEVKFGGGKTIRDGMGQWQRSTGPARTMRPTA